jgi:hypothetical protein
MQQRRSLAVMIDNLEPATPQAGLDQADVVIETLVEGGITRLMAVFHSKEPDVIEPVRSARTPYLYWASEYDSLYAHVGSAEMDGPADAGIQIVEWGIPNLDLGANLKTGYSRDPKRLAPHNVMTGAASLRQGAEALGYSPTAASPASWAFAGVEGLLQGTFAPAFSVRWGAFSPKFVASWQWDPASQRYLRTQYGKPQFDAVSGARLGFANVVIQYTNVWIADNGGHVLMDVVGEGRAQVFAGGQLIEGTWHKAGARDRTQFRTADGRPIPLLAGPTWIEVVPTSGGATLE